MKKETEQMKHIVITRVVTRDFVRDWWNGIKNLFGKRLSSYEKMVELGTTQIWQEVSQRNLTMKWYTYEITELTNGALAIIFYGESK